ncbi:hypothetical protein CRM22_006592 [Opisthorchis felineus]|uniref:Calpain catalytic domain-containing protein n=1 Tax=Opisthorchis felineus TaxID=147828 RepID=A0A4S2LK40_OPIFE|nr:hypothetical protein CRM22_006592 [Opisthorchis felineus]
MATKKVTGNISAKKNKDQSSVLPTENQPTPIWPEWSDQDINSEKWDITSTAKIRDKSRSTQSPVYFVDPEGSFVLPPSLKPAFTKRPNQFINSKAPVVFDSSSVNAVDLFYNNEHLFQNETLRWIICDIQNLWLHYQARTDTTQTKQGSDERMLHKWRPWEHIYALNKVGREPSAPQYNMYGKYIVKLYWMGCWRKITVDDVVPFDADKNMLLPQSRLSHELWPMLLTKALLKIASLSFCTGDSSRKEFGDFSAIHALTGWLKQTIYIRKQDSDSSWNSLKSYLIEWRRPEDRTVTDVRKDEDVVEENSKKDLEKSVKPAAQVKEKKLVEKKHELGREPQSSARTTPIENEAYIRPERVVFASLKSSILESQRRSLNYFEDSLRQLGLTYSNSYPVCLTAIRTIPLKLSPAPKPVPAWKLIRPRPADFLLSEEQKPSDDIEEKEPIRSVLASSAFMGTAVFRQSPEPSINSLKHQEPDEITREMSSLSQEHPNKSNYGSTKTDENVVSKPEKNGGVHSDTKKPRRGQLLLNRPDVHKLSRTSTLSAKSQENKEPLNEEVQPTEQELDTDPNIEVPNSALQLKEFWLNMDQICDLFDTVDVYHKPHTYPVKKTYENMTAAGSYTDRSPPNGLYLFVDSIHPSEAIIGLSTICQWPPPLLKSTERTSSEIEVEPQTSAAYEKKDDGATSLERSNSNWTPNQNTCPDLDHSFVTVNPPQARLIMEKVCWSRLSGNPVKCLDINAHRAISLNLPPGRHCFSLIVCSPLGYRVTVLGNPVVTFSPASHLTPVSLEKTSESLGPVVSLEKSPRLSKLTKPRQRQASPAIIMETLFQAYHMELCDEDRFFNSCLTRVPTRVRNRAHAIVAGLLNLGRIYTSLYNEEQWSTILPRRDSIEQTSSKDSSGLLSEQQAHWLLQQYASRRKELESLILTNVPDKAVSHENPIGSKTFRRSLLAILQQLCCSGETGESLATPEMNLAWRVLQWDWTTDNPFNVTYRTPRGPTHTPRSKGRMRSARE